MHVKVILPLFGCSPVPAIEIRGSTTMGTFLTRPATNCTKRGSKEAAVAGLNAFSSLKKEMT
jgi:hypothetical protein